MLSPHLPAPHASPRTVSISDVDLAAMVTLRRDISHPLYLQLEEQILALVESNQLLPGSTLPAERSLAGALGVSRVTVQNSYNALRQRKVLAGQGRRGSVVQPLVHAGRRPDMDRLKGFSEEMRELGRVPSTRLLECDVRTDRSMASLFGLRSEARFLRLVRIRCGDDVPLSVETAWYSLDAAPFLEQADPTASIYAQLADGGLALDWCEQTIETTMPDTFEREVFGFDKPTPCLLIKRNSYDARGTMVEYVEGLFRGDAYVYRLRMKA